MEQPGARMAARGLAEPDAQQVLTKRGLGLGVIHQRGIEGWGAQALKLQPLLPAQGRTPVLPCPRPHLKVVASRPLSVSWLCWR